MKPSSKPHLFTMQILLLLCIAIACKKESSLQQNSGTFLKTYQTDSVATVLQVFQMPDGGFILVSSAGSGHPLLTRTDKYGNFKWNRAIKEQGFPSNTGSIFLLADGNFIANASPGSNIIKFDTLGNINSISISSNGGNLQFPGLSRQGSDFLMTASSSGFTISGYSKGTINKIYIYDKNLTPIRTDSFDDSRIGGHIVFFYVNSISSTGAYNIFGVKYLNGNSGIDKMFAATIPSTGNATETILDPGTQKYQDLPTKVTMTKDSDAVLLGQRQSSITYSWCPLLIKVDKSLNIIWEKEYRISTATILPYNFSFCRDGGFIIVGSIQNTGFNNAQPYIVKIDQNGNKQWDKTISSEGSGAFYSGTELNDGSFALVGGTLQFGKGLNGQRILFIKTGANGKL